MPQKVIIDADPGIGAACAIAVALADPQLDVIALTAVGGRVSAVQAGRNLVSILEAIDPPKRPRVAVNDSPEAEYELARFTEQLGEEASLARRLNGDSGLGEWPDRGAELHHPRSAAKLLSELAREFPGEITLITLGPLTTISLTCELDGEFLGRIHKLVVLGGTVEAPGDIAPVTEFNVGFNPEAARRILKHPISKQMVPLDVGRKVVLTFDLFQRLNLSDKTGGGRLLGTVLPYRLRAFHQFLGMEGMPLAEVAAIAAVSRPQLFTGMESAVDVETAGTLTRGMTVFDRRPHRRWRPNVEVLTDVDSQGVLDYATGMLRGFVA